MIMKFATKRNLHGNRRYLCIDTETKQFAREPSHWFCREDFVEVGYRDLQKLAEKCKNEGYVEVDNM